MVQSDSEEPLSCVMSAVQFGLPDLMNCQCGYHALSVFANMFIADLLCMADLGALQRAKRAPQTNYVAHLLEAGLVPAASKNI